MEFVVPPAKPFPEGRVEGDGAASFGQTGNAQYGNVFNPITNQLKFFTATDTFDPESLNIVEDYIKKNNLPEKDANYMRSFGIGNQDNFLASIKFLEQQAENKDIMNRSTGLNLFLTDPALHASFAIPSFGISFAVRGRNAIYNATKAISKPRVGPTIANAAEAKFGKSISDVAAFAPEEFLTIKGVGPTRALALERGYIDPVVQSLTAREVMTGMAATPAQLAKATALGAAVVDGSVSLTEALSEISMGEDPIQQLGNAALYTVASTAMAATLGYGLGAALGKPMRLKERSDQFSTNYKAYLNGVSEKPIEQGKEVSFTGKWFTESWFMKAVPSPIRVTIQDKLLPEWAKLDMLMLGGDNGMPLVMNQINKSVGSSVFVKSGRRAGDWYQALSVIDKNYSKVAPRGKAEFFNMPIGEYVEKARRKIGMESFAPDEWYNRIGRMYVDETPYAKMTPEEAASVQAVEAFFQKYEKELIEEGLINPREIFEETFMKEAGNQFGLMSVTNSIIQQNKRWMASTVKIIDDNVASTTNKLAKLKPVKFDPKVVEAKITELETQSNTLSKEIDALSGQADTASIKEIESNISFLEMDRAPLVNESSLLSKELKTMRDKNQDFWDNRQKGFEPDDLEYQKLLDAETLLESNLSKINSELSSIDASIGNFKAAIKASQDVKAAATKGSETQISLLLSKNEKIALELQTRRFLLAEEIDADGLTAAQFKQASKLSDDYNRLYLSADDDADGLSQIMKNEESALQRNVDDFKRSTSRPDGLSAKQMEFKKALEEELLAAQKEKERFALLFEEINKARSVDELASLYKTLDLTPKMREALGDLGKAMDETRVRIDNASELLERAAKGGPRSSRYFPRFFNRRAIEANREAFRGILTDWFRKNPEIVRRDKNGLFQIEQLATDPASLQKRADDTINNILGQTDEDAVDAIFTGYGRSGPLISRRLDIPNELVKDFMVTDVKELMISYTNRVGSRLEYHKAFKDPITGKIMTLEERIVNMRQRLISEGAPKKSIDRYIKNFVATYDRVVGTVHKRPDAIDTRAAEMLRAVTSWTYLGTSGVAALGDAANLVMDHELAAIGKTFLGTMDDVSLKLAKHELNLAGEALEIVMGTTHLRYLESLSNDMFTKTTADKMSNAFYIANLLAPVTVAMKTLDGLLRGHTIVDAAKKLVAGNASKFEKEFLARYNITAEMAARIDKMPTQQSSAGLYLPNTEAWVDEDAVMSFREALRSGVMNRVIMGTPADKPIVMDGVAYIPESVARMLPFNLPVDSRVAGYRRVESGLLALPFTFYSYTMGAFAKITANHAAGAVRNRLSHVALALGIGSMIVQVRTPSWAWDQMSTEDKIARSFDFSGLAAIYSDIAYRTIAMSSELGFENPFPIEPKFKAPVDPLGAVISVFGAPADWSYEVVSAVGDMLDGNMSDGAKGLIRSTPFIGALLLGDTIKGTAQELAKELPNRQ